MGAPHDHHSDIRDVMLYIVVISLGRSELASLPGCYTKSFGFCNPPDKGGLLRVYAEQVVGERGLNVEGHRAV